MTPVLDNLSSMPVLIASGLALFLFGMQQLENGVRALGYNTFKRWLSSSTASPVGSAATGVVGGLGQDRVQTVDVVRLDPRHRLLQHQTLKRQPGGLQILSPAPVELRHHQRAAGRVDQRALGHQSPHGLAHRGHRNPQPRRQIAALFAAVAERVAPGETERERPVAHRLSTSAAANQR